MKVLLTAHAFPPSSRAGTELYTYHLAKGLQAAGVTVEVCFAEAADAASVSRRTYEGLGCTVMGKPIPQFVNLFQETDPWVESAFVDILDRFRPDVVHVNHLLHLSTGLPALAKTRGIPVVFTLHDYWVRCPRLTLLDHAERLCDGATPLTCVVCCRDLFTRYPVFPARRGARWRGRVTSLAKRLASAVVETPLALAPMRHRQREMRRLGSYVDAWIAPSRFLQDALVAWGLPRDAVLFIPHGLDTATLPRRVGPRTAARLRFGYLGTISRHKGVHVLLDAFRGLTGAELSIYGPAAPRFYRPFADVLAQGNVRVEGPITDADKARVFADLDALVVPSIWFENAPLVIREARLSGVPVICSDIGGMRESVRDTVDGYHFRAGSPGDLRRLLERCLADPARLRTLRPTADDIPSLPEHVRTMILPLYRRLVAGAEAVPVTVHGGSEAEAQA